MRSPPGLDDGGEEAARTNGGQLARVAEEHRLPLRLLHERKQRGEHTRVRHPSLIDNKHRAARKASTVLRGGEETMKRGGRHARFVGEPLGGDPRWSSAEHGNAKGNESLNGDANRTCLPRAGRSDDAEDALAARRDRAHHPLLLGGQGETPGAFCEELVDELALQSRSAGVAAPLDKGERLPLDPQKARG